MLRRHVHAHRNVGHVGHIGHDDSGVEGGSWELRDGVDAGLPNGPFPLGGLTLFLDPLLGFLGLLLGKFDLPEGFGVCKIYTSYGAGSRAKLKPTGLLSFIRKEPI